MSKEFLGTGLSFPIRVGPDSRIRYSSYEKDIQESIYIILSTAKGERVMNFDFGCGIHDLVFAPLSHATLSEVELNVREALTKYEPRINITDVTVDFDQANHGKLIVRIEYVVRDTNTSFNYVYDFYLREGNQ